MPTTKLQKVGKSTGVVISRAVLAEAHLAVGDEVVLTAEDGKIEITKAEDGYNRAMEIGRAFAQRYRQTMAILAR